MEPMPFQQSELGLIEEKIGYRFNDSTLLVQAFIHRSYVNEHRCSWGHNERLEFLGDSVLGLLMADYLFKRLPQTPEGHLSTLRARCVEAATCSSLIAKLGIDCYLLLGKGERLNEGRGRETILADLYEALIGAIYLDGGMEAAKQFIFYNFGEEIEELLESPLQNSKALLQDWCQKKYQQTPLYTILGQAGPDHSKLFTVSVSIHNRELGRGVGSSKKEAQQAAAAAALVHMGL